MQVDELLDYLKENKTELLEQLRAGKYKPNPVRRVEIPKEDIDLLDIHFTDTKGSVDLECTRNQYRR